jgi:hypothetical protein
MKVVDMNAVRNDVITIIISDAVGVTGFDTAASHPDTETTRMMVAAVVVRADFSLAVSGSTEFPTPHNEGVL